MKTKLVVCTFSPNCRQLLLWVVFDSIAKLKYMVISVFITEWTPAVLEDIKDDKEFRWWNDMLLLWGPTVGLSSRGIDRFHELVPMYHHGIPLGAD